MSAQVLLGVDVGTTALKVAAIDAAGGKLLAALARPLRVRTGSDGRREQDPRAIERSLRAMARRLQRELGARWRRVAGIGVAAQGGSAILADRQTGRPHTPMQLWNDTRPLDRLPQIAARKPQGYWKRLARLPGPGAGLARIEWHRQHYPDLFRRSRLETIFVGAGEYTFFRLTGMWRQDPGSALQVGCYSVPKRKLVKGPLDSVGVSLNFVAPLRRGHETHRLSGSGSRLLELPAGIPVAGPYIDHEAGYLSATGANGRPLQCSLGTAWVGNFAVEGTPPRGTGSQDLILPSPIGSGSLVLRVMPAGNVTWDWALREFAGRTSANSLKRAETLLHQDLLPADGLVAFPWLTRPNACAPHLAGDGRFYGIGATTTRDDMLRAVVAGMCFEFAMPFATVKSTYADAVVLGGGASKGPWFRTILASLFAPLPAYVAVDQQMAGARGSVYAFSRKAARSVLKRLRPAGAAMAENVHRQYEHYAKVRPDRQGQRTAG